MGGIIIKYIKDAFSYIWIFVFFCCSFNFKLASEKMAASLADFFGPGKLLFLLSLGRQVFINPYWGLCF